jgi:hypothetical protein
MVASGCCIIVGTPQANLPPIMEEGFKVIFSTPTSVNSWTTSHATVKIT